MREKCFFLLATFIASIFVPSCSFEYFGGESKSTPSRWKPWQCHIIDDSSQGADGVKLADVSRDGLMDIVTGWEEGEITRVYLNPGHSKAKEKWPAVTVGETRSVEDGVFVNLDGDGAIDVVSCCEGQTRTVFVSWAPKEKEDFMSPYKWKQQAIPASGDMMQWMFCVPMQVDGENGIDIIAAGKGENAQIGWFESPKNPRCLASYKWHSISDAGWIMSLILSDMDGDGNIDVVTSDRFGKMRGCRWLENPGYGPGQHRKWKNHFIGGVEQEVMFMTIADLDKDGLEDVLAATKGQENQQILYFRRLDKTGISWEEQVIPFPEGTGTGKGVAVGDIDKDGRQDIVFSCENAGNGKSGVMWISYNNKVSDAKWIAHEVSGRPGIKFDRLELLDLDGDSYLDILTCEESAKDKTGKKRGIGVFWYENPHSVANYSPK